MTTDIMQDIRDAPQMIEDSKSIIICSEAKYEELKAALDERPDLARLYRLQASPYWEDNDTVAVCAPLSSAPLFQGLSPSWNSNTQRLVDEAAMGPAVTTSRPMLLTS